MKCNCGEFFYPTLDNILRGKTKSCFACGKKRASDKQKITKDKFEDMLNEKYGEEYKIIGEYKGYSEYIDIYHEKCGRVFKTKPSYMGKGRKCNHCYQNHKKTTEEVKKLVSDYTNGEYEMLSQYTGIDNKVKILHKDCNGIFERSIQEFVNRGSIGCPYCNTISNGAKFVKMFLDKNNINYEMEKKFKECKNIKELPFDFYLPDYNICIEYDGEHHKRVLYHWGGEERLKQIQKRDNIKTEYCKENGIFLIRINDKTTALSKKREYIEDILEKLIFKQDNTELTNKSKELLVV